MTLPIITPYQCVLHFQSITQKDAIIWHKPFDQDFGRMTYDELFDNVWHERGNAVPIFHPSQYHNRRYTLATTNGVPSRGVGGANGGISGSGGGISGSSGGGGDIPFDMAKYIAQENDIGIRYMGVNRIFPNGGFKNTVFFKEMVFKQNLLTQLHPQQHAKSLLDDSKVYQYKPQYCNQDLRLFENWKKQSGWTTSPSRNEPKMCMLYAAYINNLPLNQEVNNRTIPMLDQLKRF